jgi:hypothetical protein
MSSSSSNSIEVSYSSSGGDSGSNKRKEHISNSTDSVKKVCKDNSNKENLNDMINVQTDTVTYNNDNSVKKVCNDNSNKENLDNVVGSVQTDTQIDTDTYNDDQELTDMVILDNTNTFNGNDDQELTDMILDNPQTERVNDNNDRETSGNNNPQNCMNAVIESEEFAYSIGSYVDLCLNEIEVTDGLLEQVKGILSTISTHKNCNKQFITKVTSMIKAEVIRRKPSIQNVINCFLSLINSTDLSRKNDERYEVFKQKHNIGSYTEEKSNVNGKEVFKVLRDNQIVYDSNKKERFCLKDSNDIFAITFFGGYTYINKFVRSLDDLTDKIVEKLLAALSITKHSSNDNDNNNDNNDSSSNNDNNDIDAAGSNDGQDIIDPDLDDALGSIGSDSDSDDSNKCKGLKFSDEVQEKFQELENLVIMKGKDDYEFTDPQCPLKSKNFMRRLDIRLKWLDKFSYSKMSIEDKDYLGRVRDKDTQDSGEALWPPFLKQQPIDCIEIKVDYHCCNIYTLLTRLDATGKAATCIFMIIGT